MCVQDGCITCYPRARISTRTHASRHSLFCYTWKQKCAIPDDIAWQQRLVALAYIGDTWSLKHVHRCDRNIKILKPTHANIHITWQHRSTLHEYQIIKTTQRQAHKSLKRLYGYYRNIIFSKLTWPIWGQIVLALWSFVPCTFGAYTPQFRSTTCVVGHGAWCCTCGHVCMYVYVCVCIYVCMYVRMYVCLPTQENRMCCKCMWPYIYIYIYIYIYPISGALHFLSVRVLDHVYICVHVRMNVYVLRIHAYIV